MVTVSQSRVYPRRVRHEPTTEQVAEERHRQKRLALEAMLHDHFRPFQLPSEEVYGGNMNKAVERSDSVTGCELTADFTSWLEDEKLIDAQEAAHRRLFDAALARLYAAQPYSHLVVTTHSKTGRKLCQLAEAWGHGDARVGDAYNVGLDLLLEYLQQE